MTIKRLWTQTLPIIGIEIPRVKVLKPGHGERVWIGFGGYYEGPDEWKRWTRVYYSLKVLSPDEMRVTFKSDWESIPSSTEILVREKIDDFGSSGEIRHEEGKTKYKFHWEPTLPLQSRK